MNISHLQRFAELAESKRALETSLEKVKEELSQLETGLLQEFEEDGVPSVKLNRPDGTMTIYLHRQLWAGAIEGDYPRACRALVNAGLEELVQTRFNTNQVSIERPYKVWMQQARFPQLVTRCVTNFGWIGKDMGDLRFAR